jgi:tetratricopeptide (TPR) repeat protein
MNAESVVWITERKNLMAMLFYLLSIFWFTSRARAGYGLSLFAFTLAMLSKGSAVILPLVLLGIVAWDHRLTARDGRRLLPFFLLAVGLTLFEAQFSTILGPGEIQSLDYLPRLLRAGAVIWFYAGKTLWPANLCFDYGPWIVRPGNLEWWLPLVAALATTALLWHYRQSWSRPALFAWGYFCVALLPVMGFAEVGFMRYSPVSDHFSHLALAGVAAAAGAAWARLAGEADGLRRTFLIGATMAVFALFGVLTWRQSQVYADAATLYRDTLVRNPSSWIAHTNLGVMLYESGQVEPAITHLKEAVRLKPDFAESRNDLGIAFYRGGRLADAMVQYDEALRLRPDFYQVRNNLGAALAQAGRLPEAVEQFEEALRIEPDYGEARLNLTRAEEIEDQDVSSAGSSPIP